jgi:predicted NUDIX family phosphoesterase
MSKNAHILCVAAGDGPGRYAPKVGFSTFSGDVAQVIEGDLWVGPRPHLETLQPVAPVADPLGFIQRFLSGAKSPGVEDLLDGTASLADILTGGHEDKVAYPAFLQIIPYYLFRNRGRYFNYVRPDKGSETRLHGKVSIGVGGHVDMTDIVADADGRIDLSATLDAAGKREGGEEIGVEIAEGSFRYIGTLYAIDTEVDRLHFGIVGVCDLTDEQVETLKPNHEIAEPGFRTLADIAADTATDPDKTLETWTRLVIESNPLA